VIQNETMGAFEPHSPTFFSGCEATCLRPSLLLSSFASADAVGPTLSFGLDRWDLCLDNLSFEGGCVCMGVFFFSEAGSLLW
jgi:hypothetical protein